MTAYERLLDAKARLTPEQVERIKAKCEWEHMSWISVWEQFPSLFPESQEQEGGGANQ